MIPFRELSEQMGFGDVMDRSDRPAPQTVYYTYAKGVVTEHATREQALLASNTIERFVVNQDEIDEYNEMKATQYAAVDDEWMRLLREEYVELPQEVFDICYQEAYERGHSHGHDEVANVMISVIDFTRRLLQAMVRRLDAPTLTFGEGEDE